jgi:hypothetical protein
VMVELAATLPVTTERSRVGLSTVDSPIRESGFFPVWQGSRRRSLAGGSIPRVSACSTLIAWQSPRPRMSTGFRRQEAARRALIV